MTTTQRTITLFRSGQLLDGFKTWLRIKRRHLTYKLVRAIMSKCEVQKAFADSISCGTPIGVALNEHIEEHSQRDSIEADDIRNLDRCVSDLIPAPRCLHPDAQGGSHSFRDGEGWRTSCRFCGAPRSDVD